jgi:WD40 repeat protein
VTSLAWDAQGRRLLTGSLDGRARLFDVPGGLRVAVPPADRTTAGEVRVALSPTGARLATRHADGLAVLWSDDGREVARLADAADPAAHALFLPDGSVAVVRAARVALHEPDGSLRTEWEVPLDRVSGDPGIVAAEVAPDPPRLHVLTRDGRALAYDVLGRETGRREQALGARRVRLFDGGRLAFSRGGTGDPRSETLHVLAADGASAGLMGGGFPAEATLCGGDTWWCGWTPNAGANVALGTGARVRYFPVDTQRSERLGLARAPASGTRLFTVRRTDDDAGSGANATDPLRLWTPLGSPLAALTAADDPVSAAAFSPDGSLLALGLHAGGLATVHATAPVELATEVPRWNRQDYRHPILVTADGRTMAAFAAERRVRVLADDGRERASFVVEEPEGGVLLGASFSRRDGRLLLTGKSGAAWVHDLDGRVVLRVPADPPNEQALWIGTRGEFLTVVPGPRVRFHAPDGAVVAEVAGRHLVPEPLQAFEEETAIAVPGEVRVHGPDGTARRTLRVGPSEEPFWYHGSPAGIAVLLTRQGRVGATCRCFDAAGRSLWEAPVSGVGNLAAVVARDGTRVVLHASGGLSLRDAKGAEVAHLGLGDRVTHHAFDRAGARLVAGAADGVVRVWDRDGRHLFDLPNQGGATFVGFSDDGRRIGTVTSTLTRLYTTDVAELEALAAARSTREFTAVERARFADLLAPVR